MQGVPRYKVILLPHDEKWESEGKEVCTLINKLWKNQAIDIRHVGSTAIRSICAKPILDIAVKVRDIAKLDITALQNKGYDYRGPQHGDNTYHLFVLRDAYQKSLHHIHVYDGTNKEYDDMVNFVSYLNTHPDIARQYHDLKTQLALQYPDDRASYTAAKAPFIQHIYKLINK